jgi:hypothetical protein
MSKYRQISARRLGCVETPDVLLDGNTLTYYSALRSIAQDSVIPRGSFRTVASMFGVSLSTINRASRKLLTAGFLRHDGRKGYYRLKEPRV